MLSHGESWTCSELICGCFFCSAWSKMKWGGQHSSFIWIRSSLLYVWNCELALFKSSSSTCWEPRYCLNKDSSVHSDFQQVLVCMARTALYKSVGQPAKVSTLLIKTKRCTYKKYTVVRTSVGKRLLYQSFWIYTVIVLQNSAFTGLTPK